MKKFNHFLESEEGRNFLYNRTPTWWVLRDYINEHEIGDVITRKGIHKDTNRKTGGIDTYINHLKKAGILRKAGHGKYEIIHKIPNDLATDELLEIAYPKSRWKQWFSPFDEKFKELREKKYGSRT